MKVVVTCYVFLMILCSWIVAWTLQTVFIVLSYPFSSVEFRQDVCGHIFRRVSFLFVDLLNPFWRVNILRPFPNVERNAKLIVMLNHLSNADPWIAIRAILPRDCKWICKGSLFRVPFGGWGLANNGDLAVHFTADKDGWGTKKGSVGKMMEQCKALLDRRQPIAVFPEGVRNPNPAGPVGEFKLGFFTLAAAEGATIVPIAMSGGESAWPRGDWKFGLCTTYISCGDPVEAKGLTAEELRDKVYASISSMRETHPDRKRNQ